MVYIATNGARACIPGSDVVNPELNDSNYFGKSLSFIRLVRHAVSWDITLHVVANLDLACVEEANYYTVK